MVEIVKKIESCNMIDGPAWRRRAELRPQRPYRYRYAMISSEIRRDLQSPLSYFRELDIYHFYRSAPWHDMKETEFDSRTIRFGFPFDLFWKLRSVKPDIVQGPEPLSLLMLPYLLATLMYLWLHPRVKLVTLSLEPLPLASKYHPVIVPVYRLILRWWFRRATVIFWFDSGSRRNLLANGAVPENWSTSSTVPGGSIRMSSRRRGRRLRSRAMIRSFCTWAG